MTLRERQSLFVQLVADLIQYATLELGYDLTFGEAWRSPAEAARNAQAGTGIANSLHTERLAIDLNLFISGSYREDSESHRPLGEFWERMHPDCRWGGRFTRPDGNHYELKKDA